MTEEKREKAVKLLDKILDMIEDKEEDEDRPTGEWQVQHLLRTNVTYCSICGFTKHPAEQREYNYCPCCGAENGGKE